MRLGIVLEAAKGAAGDRGGTRLFDTTHHHAQVARLHDNNDALRIEDFHDSVGDLRGEALLDLQPPGEDLGDPWELREPEDGIGRDVADVHLRVMVSFG